MSYSFSVTATDKAAAKLAVAKHMDDVAAAQPSHKADRDAAVACAGAFIDMLVEPDATHHITVSMHGSMSWTSIEQNQFIGASVSVSAAVVRNA